MRRYRRLSALRVLIGCLLLGLWSATLTAADHADHAGHTGLRAAAYSSRSLSISWSLCGRQRPISLCV